MHGTFAKVGVSLFCESSCLLRKLLVASLEPLGSSRMFPCWLVESIPNSAPADLSGQAPCSTVYPAKRCSAATRSHHHQLLARLDEQKDGQGLWKSSWVFADLNHFAPRRA